MTALTSPWEAMIVPPVPARPWDLRVVHLDASLIVLDKPSGCLSVPGRGPEKQDALATRAQARWPEARVVHRLDMDTSGLMVMARGLSAQQRLGAAFEARQVHKTYLALVAGRPMTPPTEDWHTIDLPLIVDWPNRPRSKVCPVHGKPSLTRWRLLDDPNAPADASRLELCPVTGRSHQLRVHLQAIGHPIAGDPLYAAPGARPPWAQRLMLHAWRLELPHPDNGRPMRFEAPCPF